MSDSTQHLHRGTPAPVPLWRQAPIRIAALSVVALGTHIALRFGLATGDQLANLPLLLTLAAGGGPLVYELLQNTWRREFGSDLLAGISIVTSVLLGEYLAGSIVVLMLAGGRALESYAMARASSALTALSRRMPSIAHRKRGADIVDVGLDDVAVEDVLVVYPHEICPVDGVVVDGHGVMDESYLTGEPFQMTKTQGSPVISGALNGETSLTVLAMRRVGESRYAKIMEVMRDAEERRPQLRRLGDQLGALYTPVAVALAVVAWMVSGSPIRFLAVLVVATPCPLLIAIPVAIVGSVSLAARRAIIIKSPVVLEQISGCRTAIFDKTGTLTYGEPALVEQLVRADLDAGTVLGLVASVERYSKHPLARAIVTAAAKARLPLLEASEVSEPQGEGLRARVGGRQVRIASRAAYLAQQPGMGDQPPPATAGGLECVVSIDGRYAALLRFRDAPRAESRAFVRHLGPSHHFERVMIVSGDRASEVAYLAAEVGIAEIHAGQSPEQKLDLVRRETARTKTLYVGDGINDAPAMMAATVGMAIGQNSDITAEAADVVIMDNSIGKVDEFIHISRRMRTVALQSAVGGMLLSVVGMVIAAAGHLNPVGGAVSQEMIDVIAVLNALRAGFPPRTIRDFDV